MVYYRHYFQQRNHYHKEAISISIGSSTRDKEAVVNYWGRKSTSAEGTDGDMQAARKMYRDLDGKVDASAWEEQTWDYSSTTNGISSIPFLPWSLMSLKHPSLMAAD